jgi:hypothetical protein
MGMQTTLALAIAAVFLAALPGAASAQRDWLLVSDSAEGDTRFLVDVSGFDYRVNQRGVPVFGLPLRAVGSSSISDGHVVIDARGCLGHGGQMIMSLGDATQRYWWSKRGRRMYDAVAVSVCAVAATQHHARAVGKDNAVVSKPADTPESHFQAVTDQRNR